MEIPIRQRTIARAASCSGIGLHSGKKVKLTLKPAPVNNGIKFVRIDLPNHPSIPARFNRVVDTSLATVIGDEGAIVSTIEHLMACLAGLSLDNVIVELNAYEVPVMDGSAGPFTQLILKAGIEEQPAPRHFFVVKEPIELKQTGRSVRALPDTTFRLTCHIEFDHPVIRKQSFTLELTERAFESEISKARTFGFLHEVETMQQYGLARGGSLDNAVVVDETKILNEDGLRYPDEFVRHKLLDCIGDFSLLGMPMLAHIVVTKSGHAFNHAFLEKFFSQKKSWTTQSIINAGEMLEHRANPLAI